MWESQNAQTKCVAQMVEHKICNTKGLEQHAELKKCSTRAAQNIQPKIHSKKMCRA